MFNENWQSLAEFFKSIHDDPRWRDGYDKPDILKLFDGSEREYSSALRYIRRHISVLGGAGNER